MEYEEDGVHFVDTDLLPGRMRSGWDLWDTWNRVKYLRGRKFDLIHAFETRPATIHPVRSLLRKHPAPLVIDWVDWWGRGGLIREQRPLWYRIFSGVSVETFYEEHFRTLADGTTVISRGLGARAETLGVSPDTIYWVPSGSDVSNVRVEAPVIHRSRFGLSADAFVLGFSAMDVILGVEMVLEAVQLASLSCPELILVMSGKDSRRLRNFAARKGIAKRIIHFGFLSADDYMKLMSCVDVFLLPFIDVVANHGRWPGRIRDYMAVGRPVISNPVGEMKRLATEEQIGLLADEKAADIAAKILYLRSNPELRARLGINARDAAEQRFSLEIMAARLETCYYETLRVGLGRQRVNTVLESRQKLHG